jgi:hypothetical protein
MLRRIVLGSAQAPWIPIYDHTRCLVSPRVLSADSVGAIILELNPFRALPFRPCEIRRPTQPPIHSLTSGESSPLVGRIDRIHMTQGRPYTTQLNLLVILFSPLIPLLFVQMGDPFCTPILTRLHESIH